MTLQPLKQRMRTSQSWVCPKTTIELFRKTLIASDTSTHGGFSPRKHEKVFPPLFTLRPAGLFTRPPAQELIARDLHDNEWKFRHIFRG
ncbi:hypothetical protein AAG906_012598 [Vitis piasezkii]